MGSHMKQEFQDEFVNLANLVKAAKIPDETGRTLLWCIEQLPPLYVQLCETYETRFSEKIVRLEQGMLGSWRRAIPMPAAWERTSRRLRRSTNDMACRRSTRSRARPADPKPRLVNWFSDASQSVIP